jgi:hypothetical protein
MFVDQFDQEHSRDIEPMKGGHGDNYYYQMVNYIRRYKGVRPLPRVEPRRIRIDASFGDWDAVQPEFRDTIGDPVQRRHRGWDTNVLYLDLTGRNDLLAAKVSRDRRHLYCYARTRQPLTPPGAPNWMLLFLDVDADPRTGWLGYDYLLNRQPGPPGRAILEKHTGVACQWAKVAQVPCRFRGAELELAIPWTALGLDRPPTRLDFKWADNIQLTGEASDFTLHGDAAPNDRFNYRAWFAD